MHLQNLVGLLSCWFLLAEPPLSVQEFIDLVDATNIPPRTSLLQEIPADHAMLVLLYSSHL